jgi:outer membrane protein TolC
MFVVRTLSGRAAPGAGNVPSPRPEAGGRVARIVRTALAALALLGAVMPGAARSAGHALAFAEALALAEARAPEVLAQRAAVESAGQMAAVAGELPDPKLKLGVENVPTDGPDAWRLNRDSMTMTRIGLMQDFPGLGKRAARAERASLMREREDAALAVTRASIRRDVATAWLDRWLAERTLATLRDLHGEAQSQLAVVTRGMAGGRIETPEVIAARTNVVMIRDRITDAEREVTRSVAMLERFVGEDGRRPLTAPPDLERLLPGREDVRAVVEQRPELALADREVVVARADARVATLATRPDWNLEISYGIRGSDFSNMLNVMVSMDLPLFPGARQDREAAAKLSRVEELRAQRDALARIHEAEVKALLADWKAANEKLDRFSQEILPLRRDSLWATAAAYAAGRSGLSMVLDARSMYAEALVQQLMLERERAKLCAQITYLTNPLEAAK